jgi:hypothetical protein
MDGPSRLWLWRANGKGAPSHDAFFAPVDIVRKYRAEKLHSARSIGRLVEKWKPKELLNKSEFETSSESTSKYLTLSSLPLTDLPSEVAEILSLGLSSRL